MPPLTELLRRIAASACVAVLSACAVVGPNFKSPGAPTGPAAAGYAELDAGRGDAAIENARRPPRLLAAGSASASTISNLLRFASCNSN